jgi:hypothetical protein
LSRGSVRGGSNSRGESHLPILQLHARTVANCSSMPCLDFVYGIVHRIPALLNSPSIVSASPLARISLSALRTESKSERFNSTKMTLMLLSVFRICCMMGAVFAAVRPVRKIVFGLPRPRAAAVAAPILPSLVPVRTTFRDVRD